MDDDGGHEIIECELRLHRAAPDVPDPHRADASAWAATAAGPPAPFRALADPAGGRWNGPLSPGAEVAPREALAEGWWTVRLLGSRGAPLLAAPVGRPLATGEPFTLPPGAPGDWREGVVFDGHVIES